MWLFYNEKDVIKMDRNKISKLILENTLKHRFTFVSYKSDAESGEQFNSRKITKKFLMQALINENVSIKLVDKYPTTFNANVLYVRKDGRTVWYRE
jgi:hypothetical protein